MLEIPSCGQSVLNENHVRPLIYEGRYEYTGGFNSVPLYSNDYTFL